MGTRNEIFDRARKHVERQMKLMENEQRRSLMQKRIEQVTNGVRAYQQRQIAEAVTSYHTYIRLLEEWKGVTDGGLTPSNFDAVKELGEVLLLSGVYWDLVKLYDRTDSEEKRKEFRHYLEKFVLFAKGSSFQPICSEGLRRYISHGKPKHMEDFKNAYRILGDGKCFVVTSLLDVVDEETLPTLRGFRDEVLARSGAGRAFIRVYYRIGPSLARGVQRTPNCFRRQLGRFFDRVADSIRSLR